VQPLLTLHGSTVGWGVLAKVFDNVLSAIVSQHLEAVAYLRILKNKNKIRRRKF